MTAEQLEIIRAESDSRIFAALAGNSAIFSKFFAERNPADERHQSQYSEHIFELFAEVAEKSESIFETLQQMHVKPDPT